MPITVKINGSSKDFEVLPEGVYPAVLADIVDLGMKATQYGDKQKLMFVWLTSEVDSDGRTQRAVDFVNKPNYLHEKAGLTKMVKQLLGEIPKGDDFVVDSLIGTQARLVIQHSEGKEGKVYANISSILKPLPNTKVNIPVDFERKSAK